MVNNEYSAVMKFLKLEAQFSQKIHTNVWLRFMVNLFHVVLLRNGEQVSFNVEERVFKMTHVLVDYLPV